MKKKVLALVMALAMLASLVTVPAGAVGNKTFPDAVGHWAEESILRWSRCGLVKGDEVGNVNPNKPLRRCEMATILSDMLGLRTSAPISTFKDISGKEWYARAILRCAAAGIMEGSDFMSYPEDYITREEAITMFGRALGVQPSDDPDLSDFTDGDEVSGWAAPYMAALTELGILSGMGDGTVAPHADINRAGAFTLMDKAISVYANAPGVYTSQNANGFVVVNSNDHLGGEVTITGKATGVMVTVGETNTVRFRDLTAENILVNGKGDVLLTGKSAVDALAVNTGIAVNVDQDVSVGTLDVKAEKVTVTNAGTVKTMNCAEAGNVTNSGKVENLVADAASAITNTGTVDKLVANAGITVDNTKGTVKNAEINMGGVVMDGPPQQMTVASGVVRPANSAGRPITATGTVSSGGGGGSSYRPPVKPTPGIKLDKTTATVTEGEDLQLTATVTLPADNAIKGDVIWTSSDEEIAAVDDSGKVTAVKAGTATITATVTVTIPDPTPSPSPSPDPSEDPSESPSASPSVSPSTDPSEDPSASPSVSPSTDPSEDPSASPSVSPSTDPSEDPSESPSASPSASPSEDPSESPSASPSTDPSEPTGGEGGDTGESGTEENPPAAPAAFRAGTFEARADRTTTYKATCTITVKPVAVNDVTLDKTALTLEEGQTANLVATVAPENASNKNVTWTSSKESVATVDDNGKVTAVAEGEATITVTTEDGNKTATCTVTVTGGGTPVTPSVTGVRITSNVTTVKVGETITLTAEVDVVGEIAKTVKWSSSDETKATVNEDTGVVTGKAEGKVTITATSTADDKKSATCEVTVTGETDPSGVKHTVTVAEDLTGGTVVADKTTDVTGGETVTLTVTPAAQNGTTMPYVCTGVSVSDGTENEVTVTAVEPGKTYTFTTDAEATEAKTYTVTAEFVQPIRTAELFIAKDGESLTKMLGYGYPENDVTADQLAETPWLFLGLETTTGYTGAKSNIALTANSKAVDLTGIGWGQTLCNKWCSAYVNTKHPTDLNDPVDELKLTDETIDFVLTFEFKGASYTLTCSYRKPAGTESEPPEATE